MEERKMPPSVKKAFATDLGNGIYDISTPPMMHEYLIVGTNKAILVDTGMGIGSILPLLHTITDLPVAVINTHCHPDHAGGNSEFEETWCWHADRDVFERMATKEFRVQDMARMPDSEEHIPKLQPTAKLPAPLTDGQEFDLGSRVLKIVFAPGHTHGSLCVYDPATGYLFSGDNVMMGTGLQEWNSSSVEEYAESMQKLLDLGCKKCCTGHGANGGEIMDASQIEALLSCAKEILAGVPGETVKTRGGTECLKHTFGSAAIMYRQDNIFKA